MYEYVIDLDSCSTIHVLKLKSIGINFKLLKSKIDKETAELWAKTVCEKKPEKLRKSKSGLHIIY